MGLLTLGGFAGEILTYWLTKGDLKARVQSAQTIDELFKLSCDVRFIPQIATGFPTPQQLIEAFTLAGTPPTVMLVTQTHAASVPYLIESNVQGLLAYSTPLPVVAHVIQLVRAGGRFVSQELLNAQWSTIKTMHAQPPVHLRGKLPLTQREREVLSLVKLGYSNKRIATKLEISEATVKLHVRQVMKKLNAENRTQAAIMAGLLEST